MHFTVVADEVSMLAANELVVPKSSGCAVTLHAELTLSDTWTVPVAVPAKAGVEAMAAAAAEAGSDWAA